MEAGEARAPTPTKPPLLRRVGLGHTGYRVPHRGRAWAGLLLLLLVPFVLDQLAFQERVALHTQDFTGYLDAARRLTADPAAPFYGADRGFYLYPPLLLTILSPLTNFSTSAAALVFETLKWAALVVCLANAWRLCSPRGEELPPLVTLGSLVLTWRFIDNDLANGNVNLFLLAAMLGGLGLYARGRAALAGALIALAACVKITPALLLVYFAYKRDLRPIGGALVGGALGLLLIPGAVVGWENNLRLLAEWYEFVVARFVEQGQTRSESANQALVAVLNRLLGPATAFEPNVSVAWVVLSDGARNAIRYAVGGALLLAAAWLCRGGRATIAAPPALAAEVSLAFVVMLTMSGLSWKAHFVALLLPFTLLLGHACDARNARSSRRGSAVLLVASAALCLLTGDLLTPRGADYAEAYGLILLGALISGVGAARVRRGLRARAAGRA